MPPVERPVRVMVIDDHALVRRGIVALLAMRPEVEVIGEAGDGATAIELYQRLRPDVTLMDLRMPTLSGVEAITRLRGEAPDSRFVVLTTYDGDEDVYRALQAGAQGYVLKGAEPDELVETILAVHAGERRIPAALASRVFARLGAPELTERELTILRLVVKGLSNKEIGAALDLRESTVKWHVANVLVKLGVSARTQAAVVALQRGLVRAEEG
jgi:two-component system NarL family response regulator